MMLDELLMVRSNVIAAISHGKMSPCTNKSPAGYHTTRNTAKCDNHDIGTQIM